MFLLLLTLIIVPVTNSFNLETKNTVWEYSHPNNESYFGYQVALHLADKQPKVVISAPRYQKDGAMFTCDADDKNNCKTFTAQKESINNQERINSQNHKQWLGMSVSGNGETLMACAPLWRQNNTGAPNVWYRGRCSLINNALSEVEYTHSACENELASNVFYGYCESGFSSAGIKIGDIPVYYLGAPGSLNFKGVIFAFVRGSSTSNPIQFKTNTDRLDDISSLMGYAVSSGNITGGEYGDVVGGAPRANQLKGLAILYKVVVVPRSGFQIISIFENPDDQVGSYFGAAVLVVDINGDGKDEVLVGAPQFSKSNDEGRVYIYMNKKVFAGLDRLKDPLEPDSRAGARFGTTIANVGDLNKDNYLDVAIGAPAGGPDGRGAVYIYNGGLAGLRTTPSQVIYATAHLQPTEFGFGAAISTGLDLDANTYPDIAVGSYRSGKAFVFRTKPVASLTDRPDVNVTLIPEETNCVGPNKQAYYCVAFITNLKYSGVGVGKNFDVEVSIEIDEKRVVGKRGFFIQPSTNTLQSTISKNITLTADTDYKMPFVAYIVRTGSYEVNEAIIFTTKYTLNEKPSGCGANPCPIIDVYAASESSFQVSYLKSCGDDDTCNSDLSVKAEITLPDVSQQKEIIYGAVYSVALVAKVENLGEYGYQANMKINFTSDLQVNSVDIDGKSTPRWTQKTLDSMKEELTFVFANPIKTNQTMEIEVKFSVPKLRPSSNEYTFDLLVADTGVDLVKENNRDSVRIPTKIETCVRVTGSALPPSVVYNEDAKQPPAINATLNDIGKEVNFTFLVQNVGRLPVDTLVTDVEFVIEKNNHTLLYVVDMTVDGLSCDPTQNKLNHLNYSVLYQKSVSGSNGVELRSRRDTELLDCKIGTCKVYSCRITQIPAGEDAKIHVVTRVWESNLVKLDFKASQIQTVISILFNGPDRKRNIQRDSKDCPMSHSVMLTVQPMSEEGQPVVVEWWIILLSVLGALILLAIAAAILYRFGFFERKRKIKDISNPNQATQEVKPNPEDDDYYDDDE